jgi:hypothetical protein
MKKAKILIGISMIAVLVVAMFAFSASAAPMSLSVSVNKTSLKPGETVTATVSVDNYQTALASFAVRIEYDADALTLTNVSPVSYGAETVVDPEEAANATGTLDIVWISADDAGMVSVSNLATLTFTAKAEAAGVNIGAGFKSGSVNLPGVGGTLPTPVEPGEDTFSDATVSAPSIEITPEGSNPVDPPAGTGSANADSTTADGYSEMGAYATYTVGDRTDMYRVDVNWGEMTFTYTEAAEIWDPVAHEWKTSETGVWAPSAEGANKVELTNHSSEGVTVALAFTDKADDADVIVGEFDKPTITLDAVAGEGASAIVDSDSALLTLTGKFTDELTQKAVLGNVTATIN